MVAFILGVFPATARRTEPHEQNKSPGFKQTHSRSRRTAAIPRVERAQVSLDRLKFPGKDNDGPTMKFNSLQLIFVG